MAVDEYLLDKILAAVSAVFVAASAVACLIYPGTTGLDGTIGVVDHPGLWAGMDPLSDLIYTFGDWGCHQRTARSFIIGTSQMPMCVREMSFAIGVAVGGLALHLMRGHVSVTGTIIISLVLIPMTFIEMFIKDVLGLDILALCTVMSILSGIGALFLLHCILHYEFAYLGARGSGAD